MSKPFRRRAGERINGSMTPLQRYDLAISDNMQLEDDAITRREEWMAAQILLNGSVVVEGEDFVAQTVDFGRPINQTVMLTGANCWGQPGVNALATLQAMNSKVMTASGYNAKVVIMDPGAEALFTSNPGVLAALNSRTNTPVGDKFLVGNINVAGVNAGAVGEEVKYLGQIGEFQVFVYQNVYTNLDGTPGQMIPPNTVIMGSPKGFQGIRTYGAIKDKRASLQALPRFPKMWDEEEPSITWTMTQSAPLPVSGWPEASAAITVA